MRVLILANRVGHEIQRTALQDGDTLEVRKKEFEEMLCSNKALAVRAIWAIKRELCFSKRGISEMSATEFALEP
jgi:hypothetical protein